MVEPPLTMVANPQTMVHRPGPMVKLPNFKMVGPVLKSVGPRLTMVDIRINRGRGGPAHGQPWADIKKLWSTTKFLGQTMELEVEVQIVQRITYS